MVVMTRIVVGVDGSEASCTAFAWAVREARVRGAALDAVHAWSYPLGTFVPGVTPAPTFGREDLAEDAARSLEASCPDVDTTGVEVHRVVAEGAAAGALLDAGRDADLLVVGTRGRGGFTGLLLGSVAQQCATHAECPVVVVRESASVPERVRRIVVGIDGSDGAAHALRWAIEESARWDGCEVDAVMAWGFLDQHHVEGDEFEPHYGSEQATAALRAYVERAVGADRAGAVSLRPVNDFPARGLIEAAGEADLLVVGARGLGGFRSLLLGSVSQQCLQHASCPVVVIRDGEAASS
jgi:nucleotide-binding universal stress UspA family protein